MPAIFRPLRSCTRGLRSSLVGVIVSGALLTGGCTLAQHGSPPETVEGGGASAETLNASKQAVTEAGVAVAQDIRSSTISVVKTEGEWVKCSNRASAPDAAYAARTVLLRKVDKDSPRQKVDPVATSLVSKGWKITDDVSDSELGDVYLAKGDLTAEVLTHGIEQVTVSVTGQCLESDLVNTPPYRVGVDVDQIAVP